MKYFPCIFFLMPVMLMPVMARPQSTVNYGQFWNEFAFTRSFSDRVVAELDAGQTWTGSTTQKGLFSYYSQVYGRVWLHYTAGARWRLSIFYAWYYNKYVPEIDQREYPEGRLALQAIYFIRRDRLKLSTRFRFED